MRLPVLFVLIALPAASLAGETPWQEIAPGVTARMITSDVLQAGRTMVALEVMMPQGVNTYWRVPGETGIPTRIGIEGSEGISAHSVSWPYPLRETAKGYVDYVYRGHTVLPVELTIEGDAGLLRSQVMLGICSDICVPVSARFELPLDFAAADRRHGLAIAQARALAPLPWSSGPEPIGAIESSDDGEAIALAIDPTIIDPASIILDAGESGPLFGAPEAGSDGGVLVPVIAGRDQAGSEALDLTVTFQTRQGSFELLRPVALDGSTPRQR
jgi:DsbC/DsbD-like thiol-disulfide interchange protein